MAWHPHLLGAARPRRRGDRMSAPGKLARSSRWKTGPSKGYRPLGSECCVAPGGSGREAYRAIAHGSEDSSPGVSRRTNVVKRDFDLIVYGATGYTGRLIAEYLATSYHGDDAPSWAIAGRSTDKLQKVRYDEMMVAPGFGESARVTTETFATMVSLVATGGLKPGAGPTREERAKGFYDILFLGELPDGGRVEAVVTGDRDPGYGSTSKMIAESALCLVRDVQGEGGTWTPGALMGPALRKRLKERAGLTFSAR